MEHRDPLELTTDELLEIWLEDGDERFSLLTANEWVDQGKFSSQTVVIEDSHTGKCYRFEVWRTGSYFTFYEHEVYDTAEEVKLIEKTIKVTKWVSV